MNVLYPSGIDRPEFARIAARKAVAGMINRFQLTDGILAICRQYPNVRWFIDSGAFTVPELTVEHIESYAEMIVLYHDLFEVFANCDKIGDQEQSNKNYARLLSLIPVELHSQVLWIYQYGSGIKYLQEALTEHKRIGIGGLVPLLDADYERGSALILEIAEMVAAAAVDAHYFGIGSFEMVKKLKRVHSQRSSFSVDNTSWIKAAISGDFINNVGKRIPSSDLTRVFGVSYDTDDRLNQNAAMMKSWMDESDFRPKRKKQVELQMTLDFAMSVSVEASLSQPTVVKESA